jgi:ribonuclease HII
MTDLTGVPLVEIRVRLQATRSSHERNRIAAILRRDPRRGAQALGGWIERREIARRVERVRLSKLFALRNRLLRSGLKFVAGVDEVGVGPLAGPLVAAAVILPRRIDYQALERLDDSKRLSPSARKVLEREIRKQALAVFISELSCEEVDRLNTYRGGLEALGRAVAGLGVRPDHVLVDARTIPDLAIPQTALVHGDAMDGSIAAASIVAKVYRDALMCRLAERHPGYGFNRHMGYGTQEHLDALRRLGPSPVHRRSFGPVARSIAR